MREKLFSYINTTRLRLLFYIVMVAYLVFTLHVSSASTLHADGVSTGLSSETLFRQQLHTQIQTELQKLRVPGAVVFVQSAQTGTWTATFGTSDLNTHAPISPDMHFRIGSITKTLVGTIILQLVAEGKLSLDDPISKYQPQVPDGAHITIREILDMTSGLYNYSEDDTFGKVLDGEIRGDHPNKVWTPQELLAISFQHPPDFPPGQGYHYSNTNYILLGQLIKQLTGHSPRDEIQRRIFTPLGMTHSFIPKPASAALPAPYPQGYTYETLIQRGQPVAPEVAPLNSTAVNPSWAGTAGDAISTLADLKIWTKALVNGTLISPKLQQQRLQFIAVGPGITARISYGLAIANFGGFIGHNGAIPGYQSFAASMPAKNDTIIILTNMTPAADGTGPADELVNIIIKQLTGTPILGTSTTR
jgi:D-alanyl-D-alanine carboxypeptidase